ncbi:MAG: hypothetical protein KDK23_09485 [Leptospiraceae bacterium]|nr:hypothetical protein [Leptospiraceae bacterium]
MDRSGIIWMAFAGLLLSVFSACRATSPAPFLGEQSVFYIGDFGIAPMYESSVQVEFILGKAGWKGFKANSFLLQIELRQGTYVSYQEKEFRAIDQPYSLKEKVSFVFPIREVTYAQRGMPRERMNLSRDFQACLHLKEWSTEALLATQCYDVSDYSARPWPDGIRVVRSMDGLTEAPEGRGDGHGDDPRANGLPPGIPGAYLATKELPGLGLGALKLESTSVLWTPAAESDAKTGAWEQQGDLILIRFGDESPLLLLQRKEEGFLELNSRVLLRSVD